MKNKLILLSLIAAMFMCFAFVACKDNRDNDNMTNNNSHTGTQNNNTSEPSVMSHTITEDNVTISLLNAKEEEIIGTGEYFLFGVENRRIDEYKKIVVTFKIENKKDEAIGYSQNAWKFEDKNNTPLEHSVEQTAFVYNSIGANDTKEEKIDLYVKKDIDIDKIIATYNYMDYNENYWSEYARYILGDFSKEEYEDMYKTKELKLSINVT